MPEQGSSGKHGRGQQPAAACKTSMESEFQFAHAISLHQSVGVGGLGLRRAFDLRSMLGSLQRGRDARGAFGWTIGTEGVSRVQRPKDSAPLALFLLRRISKAFTELVHHVSACPKQICSAKAFPSGNAGAQRVSPPQQPSSRLARFLWNARRHLGVQAGFGLSYTWQSCWCLGIYTLPPSRHWLNPSRLDLSRSRF
jgi:hypothetical protein